MTLFVILFFSLVHFRGLLSEVKKFTFSSLQQNQQHTGVVEDPNVTVCEIVSQLKTAEQAGMIHLERAVAAVRLHQGRGTAGCPRTVAVVVARCYATVQDSRRSEGLLCYYCPTTSSMLVHFHVCHIFVLLHD